MYQEFFGLREKPFALAPDPRYLYMSHSHREALAHMLYGIEDGHGFIEVVGQVGTGKTTLCRTLLDRIGDDAEIAFIFNPSPSELELLVAINREFGRPTEARSRTELLDDLNRFLLEKKGEGRRVLLVIDEAQNLEPEVLEQIRLLSNLETQREKLIQIILLGQPELEENLSRRDLRQLRQRITVRWELRAFSRAEVVDYIGHRLTVAGRPDTSLFTDGAMRAIWRRTRGVPRLINALADRALLMGYSRGKRRIDAALIRAASRELPASELSRWPEKIGMTLGAAAAMVVLGVLAGLAVVGLTGAGDRAEPAARATARGEGALSPSTAAAPAMANDALAPVAALEPARTAAPFASELLELTRDATSAQALDRLLDAWGYPQRIAGELSPNRYTSAVNAFSPLRVFSTRATTAQLVLLDLPGVLELAPDEGELRYAAVLGVDPEGRVRLATREREQLVDAVELERLWTGRAIYLWSNFESLPALALGMTGSAVRWLQTGLTQLGYLEPGDASGEFDETTVAAIERFQLGHGLDATGDVDTTTIIALYQALDYDTPRLAEDGGLL